jgi:hypothetical protein
MKMGDLTGSTTTAESRIDVSLDDLIKQRKIAYKKERQAKKQQLAVKKQHVKKHVKKNETNKSTNVLVNAEKKPKSNLEQQRSKGVVARNKKRRNRKVQGGKSTTIVLTKKTLNKARRKIIS